MPQKLDLDKLIKTYTAGDRLSLSRLISLVENNSPLRDEVIKRIYPYRKGVYRLGLTGPPGVGKSTLVTELVKIYRERHREERIGVVAVDPSSPFTGGALLGDRVRMNRISLDDKVFIRSLATRGSLGGLANATEDVVDLMDGFGCGIVIIETVGVGQAELDIVKSADTTVVTLIPGGGDSIQALKAGLMEIGDIFILNKSDREGADRAFIEIETALHFRPDNGWRIPIVKTVAIQGEGTGEALDKIEEHRNFITARSILEEHQSARRREKIIRHIQEKLEEEFWTEDRLQTLNALIGKDISAISAAEILSQGDK